MFRMVPQALLAPVVSIILLAPAQAARHQHFRSGTPHLLSNQGSLKSEAAPDSIHSHHRLAAGWRRPHAPVARNEARKRAVVSHNLEGAGRKLATRSGHRFPHRNAWTQVLSSETITTVAHPAGCPATAFCGCGASVQVFGHPVRELWLAANWFKFPPASPAPGMAAVRAHHVVVIMLMRGGDRAMVYDANSGRHETHIHEMSLAGYSIRNPHAGWRPRA